MIGQWLLSGFGKVILNENSTEVVLVDVLATFAWNEVLLLCKYPVKKQTQIYHIVHHTTWNVYHSVFNINSNYYYSISYICFPCH